MSEKIYGWLLKLYPRRFREEYGTAARQLFRDRRTAERGFAAHCRLWFDVLGDLAVSLPREHQRSAHPPQLAPGEYQLPEEAISALLQVGHRFLLISWIPLALGFGMGWMGAASLGPLLFGYGLLALCGAGVPFLHRAKSRRRLRAFRLTLAAGRLQRIQPGLDMTLLRNEVTRIVENDHGLMLWATGQRSLWIPTGLNGYQQVREQLAEWRRIEAPDNHETVRWKHHDAALVGSPFYVSALLVRSLYWFVPLALAATVYLVVLARIRRRQAPAQALFLPLAMAAVLLFRAFLVFQAR